MEKLLVSTTKLSLEYIFYKPNQLSQLTISSVYFNRKMNYTFSNRQQEPAETTIFVKFSFNSECRIVPNAFPIIFVNLIFYLLSSRILIYGKIKMM